MCLGIPGKIVSISSEDDDVSRTALVDFGGIQKSINISLLPEARVNDFLLAHVGIGLTIIDEAQAQASLTVLQEGDWQ